MPDEQEKEEEEESSKKILLTQLLVSPLLSFQSRAVVCSGIKA